MMLHIDVDEDHSEIIVKASFWDQNGCLQEDTQSITKEMLLKVLGEVPEDARGKD